MVWWSTPRPSRFTPEKETQYPCTGGWVSAPGPVCTENLFPTGIDPQTVQPLASRYTDCAILAHN